MPTMGQKIRKYIVILPMLVTPMVCGGASSSYALTDEQLVQGAKECTRYINRYERQYAIPTHLLSAIASTESGRMHRGMKINVPWPWTINVQGKGHFYDTKKQAIAAVRSYQAQGIKSIDVGCMQVNLVHHGKNFKSLDEAFDPKYNVAYAANFLRELYLDTHSWKEAAGDYHSKTGSRGAKYASNVYSSWHNIIDKLRTAKIQTSQTTVASAEPSMFKPIQVAKLPEQRGKDVAGYQTPRMRVVEVAGKTKSTKTATVTVMPAIRVVNEPKSLTVANVEPASLTMTQTVTSPAAAPASRGEVREVDHSAPASGRAMPTFIFTN